MSPRPPAWKGYLYLTRLHMWPTGTMVVFWPSVWALSMCAYSLNLPPKEVAVQTLAYLVGSTIRHNAGCIWNDICDMDVDGKVERTKSRPLPSGMISLPAALLFFVAHMAVCMYMLSFMGPLAFKFGLVCLLTFDLIYPLTKRFTNWPQAWLGLGIAWGFPVVWVSYTDSVDLKILVPVVLGIICWTIHFDTVYARQDREEDAKAGAYSCAIYFGDYIRPILTFFTMAFVTSLAYAGYLNGQGPLYFLITVAGTALNLIWQLSNPELETGKQSNKLFQANHKLGYIIWGGMLFSRSESIRHETQRRDLLDEKLRELLRDFEARFNGNGLEGRTSDPSAKFYVLKPSPRRQYGSDFFPAITR
ncbi:uncharacterized protein FIBRA_08903 [Fibroporia radiculosa]|uniref:Uncharacterized protein n=1 Tax=Fibroporia radiculosa TaxID=599839 RepID=J4GIH2_9APHY|nr:uncharacterized protein FIBRA_08903 [Fibroporia radiculosa]CCM06623.1 predicted protein [Fibroporia radiculosa]